MQSHNNHQNHRRSLTVRLGAGTVTGLAAFAIAALAAPPAGAIGTTVGLGTAASYSVLGGQAVTNTGPSVLSRGIGVSPGSAISGFPPGIVLGASHSADAASLQAQSDLTTAYDAAAGQASDATVTGDLGGLVLTPGVYTAASSIGLTGPLTLDAQGDPDAVFVFQIGSALTTATSSSVVPVNGARSCNVFWQVGSSASLGTSTSFVGTIMALTSITLDSGATVDGRALARNGAVTLQNNVFTGSDCATTPPTSPPSTTTPTTPPTTGPGGGGSGGGGTGGSGDTGSGGGTGVTPPDTTATGLTGSSTGSGNGNGRTGTLAATGAPDARLPLAATAATLLLGSALLLAVRRRRTASRPH